MTAIPKYPNRMVVKWSGPASFPVLGRNQQARIIFSAKR